jgi:hypothetical protein
MTVTHDVEPDIPCLTCQLRMVCRSQRLACKAFQVFSESGTWVAADRRQPSADLYRELFEVNS